MATAIQETAQVLIPRPHGWVNHGITRSGRRNTRTSGTDTNRNIRNFTLVDAHNLSNEVLFLDIADGKRISIFDFSSRIVKTLESVRGHVRYSLEWFREGDSKIYNLFVLFKLFTFTVSTDVAHA